MPLVVQYGMPLDTFWHGDMRLLEVYQKAYMRNANYITWLQGSYNRFAVQIGVSNALATKESEKIKNWLDYKDPVEQMVDKPKITKENLEQEFRKQQCSQTAWISNILKQQ